MRKLPLEKIQKIKKLYAQKLWAGNYSADEEDQLSLHEIARRVGVSFAAVWDYIVGEQTGMSKKQYLDYLAARHGFSSWKEFFSQRLQERGFSTKNKYQQQLAQDRGFSSRHKYEEDLVRQQGYASRYAYEQQKAKENGHSSLHEYHEKLATRKGYKSLYDQEKARLKRRGFEDPTEYQADCAQQRQQQVQYQELSNLIRQKLRELGESQQWLAEQLGIAKSCVSNYAQGKLIPRQERLKKLYAVLGISRGTLEDRLR